MALAPGTHVVEEHADQLEVPLGPIPEDNAVPLLAHQQQHGDAEVGIHQRLTQTLRRLLGVAHLVEVRTLHSTRKTSTQQCSKLSTRFKSPYLCLKEFASCQSLQLGLSHLLSYVYPRHLLNHLLQHQQVKTRQGEEKPVTAQL